jgi:hypothetical protein
MTPIFTHDCTACQFLGIYELPLLDEQWDLYYCPAGILGGTALARYGSEGHEYSSCDLNVLLYAGHQSDSPLLEVFRRKIQQWQALEAKYAV